MSDDRWPPFIPRILDDYPLDPYEFRVLCRVARRQSTERGCDESNRRTGEECGMSESKVRDAKDLLVRAGLLKVTSRDGRTSEYRLAPPSKWKPADEVAEFRKKSRLRRRQKDRRSPQPRRQEPRRQEPRSSAPDTAAPGTAQPQRQEPRTAARGADEGTPGKVLPEGDSSNGDGATPLVEKLHRLLGVPLNRRDLVEAVRPRLADGWSADGLLDHLTTAYEREDGRPRGVGNPTGFLLTVLSRCPDPAPAGSHPDLIPAAKRWGKAMAATLDVDAFTEAADRQYLNTPDARAAAQTAYEAERQARNDPGHWINERGRSGLRVVGSYRHEDGTF